MTTLPKKLEIGIGGYMGKSYSLKLTSDEKLEYGMSDYGYKHWKKKAIKPSDEMWTAFRKSLDAIKIWKWEEHYPNPEGICDGTSWGIDIAYDDVRIHTSGSNNYPQKGFEQFLKAVQTLIGGREFS